MLGKRIHRNLYIISITGIGLFLPLSEYMTSVFIITLTINWILEAGIRKRYSVLSSRPELMIFLSAYMVYLVWMVNTSDLASGLHMLRLNLPLLFFPLVVGTSESIGNLERKIIFSGLVGGVLIASIWGSLKWFIILPDSTLLDRRELSPFISHIRLSLMICMAIMVVGYYYVREKESQKILKLLALLIVTWLVTFLFIMVSYTGIIILAIILYIKISKHVRLLEKELRFFLIGVMAVAPILLMVYLGYQVKDYLTMRESGDIDIELLTINGNSYSHDQGRNDVENGFYVWRYICEDELRKEWNRVSGTGYDGKDIRGNDLRYTLIRYLTSMGEKKDSAGISHLDSRDIATIESGYANIIYRDGTGIQDKVYETIWQIDYFIDGGNPQGHSITQKLAFINNGWKVFESKPFFGTGTGDLTNDILSRYDTDGSELDPEYRMLPHNQYLTILVRFGIIGFILFWGALVRPLFQSNIRKDILFLIFLIIVALSMMGEDTLETHTGISFFACYYSIFCFSPGKP